MSAFPRLDGRLHCPERHGAHAHGAAVADRCEVAGYRGAFRDLLLMTMGAAFKHGGAYDASMLEIDLKPRELHAGRRSRSTRKMCFSAAEPA